MYPGQVNSPFTTTLGEISATDTAVVVADASVLPAEVPFLLTLGYDKSASETVLVTAVSGNTLTITRAVDGPALLWVAGTKAARVLTAKDLNDIQNNIRSLNQDKQENLTIDSAPTQNSKNPVSSGGVQSALAGKQNTLTIDPAPVQNSQNLVTSGGVFSALAGKQPNLTFDTAPTQGSQNPVTSGGIHTALSAKANAASLASHTGNTSNPHNVTAEQIGAATPAQVDSAIDEVSGIGDIRTTVAKLSDKWLPCDGRGIYSSSYPTLVPLLQAANPAQERITIASEVFTGNQYPYGKGAACFNGTWAFVGCGYNSSSSKTLNIPVVYVARDVCGDWKEIRLSTGAYYLSGILYNPTWGKWVAYGHQYVSDTECYPYIFYAADPFDSWTAYKVSSTPCKITGAACGSGKMVLIGRGCGSANNGFSYAYIASGSISFSQNNFSTNSTAPSGIREHSLSFGNGYWAFVDGQQSIWYTTDPAGLWTQNKITTTGVQIFALCYGGGTWCACGMQNSGGYGRAFYGDDITAAFTDTGLKITSGSCDYAGCADGVFLMLPVHLSSGDQIVFSTNRCRSWTTKKYSLGTPKALAGAEGKWLIPTLYNSIVVLRRPEADAVVPELKPEFGTVYIKAK